MADVEKKTITMRRRHRNDAILIAAIIAATCICFIWMWATRRQGATVLVKTDGNVSATYPLDADITVDVSGASGGKNTLKIQDGIASITDADCPDRLCVHQRSIRYDGETIVCLPHRVVIEISGGGSSDVDAIN